MRQVVGERRADGGDKIGGRGGERGDRLGDLGRNIRRGADPRGDGDALGETLADGGEIARAAAIERQARQGAGKIGRGGKGGADGLTPAGIGKHPGDRIEAPGDDRRVG